MKKEEFVLAVRNVFDMCRNLSKVSGYIRNFTPDGRMVGDIGEVIAEVFYGIKLHDDGHHCWDGIYNGRNVQIKTTGGNDTYLKEPPKEGFADGLLLVFWIDREGGNYEVVYNGDIQRVWDALHNLRISRDGGKMISLDRLRELQKSVSQKDIIIEVDNYS